MEEFIYLKCPDCKARKECPTESRNPKCHKCGSTNAYYYDDWYAWITIDKKRRKIKIGPKKSDVKAAITAAREGKEYIRLSRKKAITFSNVSSEYLTHCTRQASYEAKKHHLDHFTEIFGKKPIYEVSPDIVRNEHKNLAGSKTPTTADRYLATLKTCFQFAENQGHIDYSVLHAIQKVKLFKPNNKRNRRLTVKEYYKLLEAARTAPCKDLADIITFAVFTGLRQANVLGCRRDKHIDTEAGLLRFQGSEMKSREELTIPITPTIADIIKKRSLSIGSPYLFFNQGGEAYSRHTITDNFKLACQRANLDDFHFHDLRHTIASWLGAAGANARYIQDMLGHSSMSMTQRYTHTDIEHLRTALLAVEEKVLLEVE